MNLKKFNKAIEQGKLKADIETFEFLHKSSDRAYRILSKLNNKYHTQPEIRSIFSKLIKKEVPKSFRLFPPFYSEFGMNITVGKNVFVNMCCMFQDQGGIYIDKGSQIGHGVTMVTLNHDMEPENRSQLIPSPIHIGQNVWVGAGSIILPGVSIGDGAVIGAGSVVTKDVPENSLVYGQAAQIREIF